MNFYYAPGACSLGIHFLLEEIGVDYEGIPIIIRDGEQFTDSYVAINPKSKVPALQRDDGSVLTEFGVIALWLAHTQAPDRFKSADLEEELSTMETLDYIVATVHMQGYTRILRPVKFTPNESDFEWVKEWGKAVVMTAMSHLSDQLGDRPFIMGTKMTIADAAFFYTLFWGIGRLKLEMPGNITAYYRRLAERPAAQRAFELEGLV